MVGFFVLVFLAAIAGVIYPYVKPLRRWHFGLAALGSFVAIGIAAPDQPPDAAPKTVEKQISPATRVASDASRVKEQAKISAIDQMKREIASIKTAELGELKTKDAIMLQVAVIGARAKIAADNPGPFTSVQAKIVADFKKSAVNWQVKAFPMLRSAQANVYDTSLWEQNIDVKAYGMGNRNIRFIGGMLASNSVKKMFHENGVETFRILRFNKDLYEWYKGSEGTYWENEPIGDKVLATLDEDGWTPIR